MAAFFAFAVAIVIVFCSIRDWRTKQVENERKAGEKIGYDYAYSRTADKYKPKVNDQRKIYSQKNEKLKLQYDKKIKKAKIDGLATGKRDKLAEIENQILVESKQNQIKGNWDSVLYEVKD